MEMLYKVQITSDVNTGLGFNKLLLGHFHLKVRTAMNKHFGSLFHFMKQRMSPGVINRLFKLSYHKDTFCNPW